MARVLLNRLIPTIAQENTPESQCGFRSNRGTVDMICVLRQIQEKCRKQNMGLCAAFVDLTKAFDTVSRDGLWKILARLGCPPKFLTIPRQLHEGQQGQVKHNGFLSGTFPSSNGVKLGCALPPHCSPSSSASCSVRQKKTCQTASTFVSEQAAVSDGCALLAHTEEALQHIVNRFFDAAKNFGLTISLKKTEVLYQPPPREAYSPPQSASMAPT